jgi:oligopeptide transport system ATP-binding protein
MTPLLSITDLKKHFPIRSGLLLRRTGTVYAVDGVSFSVGAGETLGLVGESGCGKSTLGRAIVRIETPTAGKMSFEGLDVTALKGRGLKGFRRDVQMVFQDPYGSLNPRMTVANILRQPLRIHDREGSGKERLTFVASLLERVGLGRWALNRYPHEFSGGQRQRIAIARALALHPKLIVADEAVSALDVSVQAQILNLLKELKREFGMAYLFIAHDLAVVRHMADRVAVMYLGKIVELAGRDELFRAPKHPYTRALLSAIPRPGVRGNKRVILKGDVPSPVKPPSGCAFHPRCPVAEARCRVDVPALRPLGTVDKPREVACHLAL